MNKWFLMLLILAVSLFCTSSVAASFLDDFPLLQSEETKRFAINIVGISESTWDNETIRLAVVKLADRSF